MLRFFAIQGNRQVELVVKEFLSRVVFKLGYLAEQASAGHDRAYDFSTQP